MSAHKVRNLLFYCNRARNNFVRLHFSGGSAPTARSKYILDPSVQSGPSYGQTASMYAPPAPATFNNQPFGGAAPINNYSQFQPQPFASAGTFNQTPFQQPYNNQPVGMPAGPPSILSPAAANNLIPGVPPIELAQQALPQQVQRNPTPPPGWNDPPPLTKSARQVNMISI